jgi:transposase
VERFVERCPLPDGMTCAETGRIEQLQSGSSRVYVYAGPLTGREIWFRKTCKAEYPTQFGSARKLASWAGLTPTVRGSDRTVRHGHISKQGSAWPRWVLCQAAQTAKRHPDFAPAYEALARRRGTKIATTAVAHKLLTRAYHLLTDASTGGAPS